MAFKINRLVKNTEVYLSTTPGIYIMGGGVASRISTSDLDGDE
jgi:hypothetical protein